MNWFRRKKKVPTKFIITESTFGTWSYHWSMEDYSCRSLCGGQTMITSLSHDAWGYEGHLKESYCSECERLKNNMEKHDGLLKEVKS